MSTPEDIDDNEVVEERRPQTDSPTLLRKNFKHHLLLATRQGNKEVLKSAIQNYEELNNRESDTAVVARARDKLFILETKYAIAANIKKKDTEGLKSLLTDIRKKDKQLKQETIEKGPNSKNKGVYEELSYEIRTAKKFLKDQVAAEERKSSNSNPKSLVLNKQAMADVTTYRKPPPCVHSVLQATLLLFGEDEGLTSDWNKCKALVHPTAQNGLLKRLPGIKYHDFHAELVARAREIMDAVEFENVLKSSRSAACFYNYCCAVIDNFISEGKLNGVQPANIERQREILNRPLTPRTVRYEKLMEKNQRATDSPVVEIKVL